jgi:hypothetical protein
MSLNKAHPRGSPQPGCGAPKVPFTAGSFSCEPAWFRVAPLLPSAAAGYSSESDRAAHGEDALRHRNSPSRAQKHETRDRDGAGNAALIRRTGTRSRRALATLRDRRPMTRISVDRRARADVGPSRRSVARARRGLGVPTPALVALPSRLSISVWYYRRLVNQVGAVARKVSGSSWEELAGMAARSGTSRQER